MKKNYNSPKIIETKIVIVARTFCSSNDPMSIKNVDADVNCTILSKDREVDFSDENEDFDF